MDVSTPAVGVSSATESAVSAQLAASTAAAAAALVGATPMGADADSAQFCAALNAAGATYLGVAGEHSAQRGMFAGQQSLSAATYEVTEAARTLALGL